MTTCLVQNECESASPRSDERDESASTRSLASVRGRVVTGFTEATEVGAKAKPLTPTDLLPAHLLDGDEIVILAIKPSLWFILFASSRWLVAMGIVIALSEWIVGTFGFLGLTQPMVVQAALALAGARFGFALLQWVSRLYVLTNRRIMRLMGIFNVDLFECPLTKIQNTYLSLAWYERLTGVGSIGFATAGTGGIEASWLNVNNPMELHERLRSAIRRAQQGGPGGAM